MGSSNLLALLKPGGSGTPHTAAEKLAAEVSGPCVLSVIEGGNHVVNNLWYRYRDQTADWMAKHLDAK